MAAGSHIVGIQIWLLIFLSFPWVNMKEVGLRNFKSNSNSLKFSYMLRLMLLSFPQKERERKKKWSSPSIIETFSILFSAVTVASGQQYRPGWFSSTFRQLTLNTGDRNCISGSCLLSGPSSEAWMMHLCLGEGWNPETGACSKLQQSWVFMSPLCFMSVGNMLAVYYLIKAGFMTSLKENKKGKDPSAYSSRLGWKLDSALRRGGLQPWKIKLGMHVQEGGSLKGEAKQEQLSWWRCHAGLADRPSTHLLASHWVCRCPGHSVPINKGHIHKPRPQGHLLSPPEKITRPHSPHNQNQTCMEASETRKIEAENTLLPLENLIMMI